MPDQTVQIGFVGVGSMGQCAHLKNYNRLQDCEVVALAEIRPKLAQKVAARYGIPNVYSNHEDMLENEDLDGIVASQPFDRHGVLVLELLEADVPVFTEKPLAASCQIGEQIVEAEQKAGATHMVGYHKRSDPATVRTVEEIENLKETGELGDLKYVRILMPAGDWVASGFNDLIQTDEQCPDLDRDPPPPDMNEETFQEYTAFVNYYIHQVNLMRLLFGEPYDVTYAEPSGVLMAVQSQSGVAGTIEMSPYVTTVDWQESALVCFEKGWIRLDLPAPLACNRAGKVSIFRDPGCGNPPETRIPQLPWTHAMQQQAANFTRVCRGETDPPCDSEEALEDLRIARNYIHLKRET
ncbi:MAG: Gfo/Idh/MocA family oxidoreductase [Planctomycetes bacterium]|nr:Gfo/Idh/MocA family oxidoreductase [Planctomycetota bacterium]